MANYNLFQEHSTYKQVAPACLMVSYGTIIEYFTYRNKHVDSVLHDYRKKFIGKLPAYKTGKLLETLENCVYKHIHSQCLPIDRRGCDYLHDMHENDDIKTYDDCEIISWSAPTPPSPITQNEIDDIKKELEENDSVALVLYPSEGGMHTVVVGFDTNDGNYFCKDPNKSNSEKIDILSTHLIYEYIVFSALI